MFSRSIRSKFLLWLGFLLVCILIGFGATAYRLLCANQDHDLYEQLQRRLAAVSGDLSGGARGRQPGSIGFPDDGSPPKPRDAAPNGLGPGDDWKDPEPGFGPHDGRWPGARPGPPQVRLSADVLSLFDQTSTNSFYFSIWNRDGFERLRSSNAPPDLSIPDRVGRARGPQIRIAGGRMESFLQHNIGYRVLVGRSLAPELAVRRHFALGLIGAGAIILAIGLCGSWWLAGRALRPVAGISAAATRISAGNLAERINAAETSDELGQLAGTLNSTFARLEASFAQQKQFTADASHELRTPIAVIISEAQTTLTRERTPKEYREAIEACLDTAQQMRRLTESLLELANLDASQQSTKREPLDLSDVVRQRVEFIHPLADQRGLKLNCKFSPAKTSGNADHLGLVINNLLSNAIHYNRPNGEITITTGVAATKVFVSVSDTGVGIAPQDLPLIFDRFYRADKSRSRAEGRSGLGLAICKAIVEAHGGSIEVASQFGVGATFTVHLPA